MIGAGDAIYLANSKPTSNGGCIVSIDWHTWYREGKYPTYCKVLSLVAILSISTN